MKAYMSACVNEATSDSAGGNNMAKLKAAKIGINRVIRELAKGAVMTSVAGHLVLMRRQW